MKISIDLTESDIEELREGKEFNWRYPSDTGEFVDVHLYNSDLNEEEEN